MNFGALIFSVDIRFASNMPGCFNLQRGQELEQEHESDIEREQKVNKNSTRRASFKILPVACTNTFVFPSLSQDQHKSQLTKKGTRPRTITNTRTRTRPRTRTRLARGTAHSRDAFCAINEIIRVYFAAVFENKFCWRRKERRRRNVFASPWNVLWSSLSTRLDEEKRREWTTTTTATTAHANSSGYLGYLEEL